MWVTLIGKRVPFANICLHSAVQELLRKRSQQDLRKPSAEPIKRKHQSLPRVKICPPPEKGHPNEEDLSSPTLESPTGSFDSGRDEGQRKGVSCPGRLQIDQYLVYTFSSASAGLGMRLHVCLWVYSLRSNARLPVAQFVSVSPELRRDSGLNPGSQILFLSL